MQISKAKVNLVELQLETPIRMAHLPAMESVVVIFLRIETRKGENAWGCAIAHSDLTGEKPEDVVLVLSECADLIPDLHPTNIEYSLAELAPLVESSPGAACAVDLAFHDLFGLAAGMPLYRLLGGYRNRIQTSVTIPIASVRESVELACARANLGFRIMKIKGGLDPDEDVHRIRAIHRALPDHTLRLDADGGYSVQSALEVARALEGKLEMLEQPTPFQDLEGLQQVTRHSPVPILVDQSVSGPISAFEIAAQRYADGMSVKLATCGGLRNARQIDAIARAANLSTMVGCLVEPALLISAGLSLALSSPNVHYGDLDGHLEIVDDPCVPGFHLENGWLVATDVPGLGCTVEMG